MAIKNRTAFFILVFIIGLNRFRPDFLARFPLELRVPLTLKIPLPFFLWKWSFRPRPTAIPGLRIYAGGHCIKKEGSAARHGNCGEDSYFISLGKKGLKSKSVLAVADGVGGWATHGGDSSGVSNGMMKAMKKFHLDSPFFDSLTDLVDKAFQYLVSSAQLSMGIF